MSSVNEIVKLQLNAGQAVPGQKLGPVLSPRGINVKKFCDEFNSLTKGSEGVIPVEITVYRGGVYKLKLKKPTAAFLIRKEVGKGVSTITKEQITKIAIAKKEDLNVLDVESCCKIIMGTARSMGITEAEI